jgi:hypothetical protein
VALIRILEPTFLDEARTVRAHPGRELVVDGATARRLCDAGDAERVIDRSSPVERAVER